MANLFETPDDNSRNLSDGNIDLTSTGGVNFWFDKGFTWIVYIFSSITVVVLFVMTWVIFQQAQPAISQFGFSFLWGQDWDTGNQIFGALPYIYGTLVSSAIAILLTIPVGISIALVTSEDFLPNPVKSTIAFVVELIAAIPSVIIGLWGIFIFIPVIQPLEKWLGNTFAFIPFFNTPKTQPAIIC